MQAVDYRYSQRQFLHRDEPQCFRSLPLTTRSLGDYCRKAVDPDGGWLQLGGLSPADAVRRAGHGYLSRGDFRNIKRAVPELLEAGFLALGELDDDGMFLPLGHGDYLAIRDWVPSQRGMTRKETAAYYAEQEERAARYLARLQAPDADEADDQVVEEEAAPSRTPTPSANQNDDQRAGLDTSTPPAEHTVTTPKPTRQRPTAQRQCNDRSASTGNSNGTELALFHTIPFRKPPISPKGERGRFFDPDSSPSPSDSLAEKAIEWLNQQRTTPAQFRADNPDMQRQAQRWRKAGWDWPLLRKALDLRLAALKAVNPDGWENWATPWRLFDRKLRHFVHEALAGHSYRPAASPRNAALEGMQPARASGLYDRAAERARAQRQESAERAFADVLTVASAVGANGDWQRRLRHATTRRVIGAIGWKRIVGQGEAIRDKFLGCYLGGPGHAIRHAAA